MGKILRSFFGRRVILIVVVSLAVIIFLIAVGPTLNRNYMILSSRLLDHPVQRSTLQLMATPEKYDGMFVSLMGWCVVDFERQVIQLTSDDDEWFLGIWLDLNEEQVATFDFPEPRLCTVDGVLRDGLSGHMGRWPAKLAPVRELVVHGAQEVN